MKSARFLCLVFLILIFPFSIFSYAGVPQMINYQGKLTTPAGALIHDTLSMVFTIYDVATDGGVLWTETQPSVVVEKGVFSVLLGAVNPLPDTVFTGNVRYLGVKVEDDPEMTPTKAIVSVGYAYKSEYADTADYARVAVSDGDWTISGDNIYRLTGKVGIGTTSPETKLHLYSNSGTDQFIVGGSVSEGRAVIGYDHTNNFLKLVTYKSGYGNVTIPEGNVGIGTTNPTFRLDVQKDSNAFEELIRITNTNSGDHAASGIVIIDDAAVGLGIGRLSSGNTTHTGYGGPGESYLYTGHYGKAFNLVVPDGVDGKLNFFVGTTAEGTPKMVINKDGEVGIGTTNPETKLHLYSNSGGNAFMVGGSMSEGRAVIGYDHTNNRLNLVTYKSGYGNVTIPEGKVGIGTTNPGGKLEVSGVVHIFPDTWTPSGPYTSPPAVSGLHIYKMNQATFGKGNQLLIGSTNVDGSYAQIGFGWTNASEFNYAPGVIGFVATKTSPGFPIGDLVFGTRNTTTDTTPSERMRITSEGNIGIGTTTPQGALDVKSTTGAFIVPRMTTAQRDALTAVNGMIIYNTTTNQFNFYENGAWVTK